VYPYWKKYLLHCEFGISFPTSLITLFLVPVVFLRMSHHPLGLGLKLGPKCVILPLLTTFREVKDLV
jgi:hypothetical protein